MVQNVPKKNYEKLVRKPVETQCLLLPGESILQQSGIGVNPHEDNKSPIYLPLLSHNNPSPLNYLNNSKGVGGSSSPVGPHTSSMVLKAAPPCELLPTWAKRQVPAWFMCAFRRLFSSSDTSLDGDSKNAWPTVAMENVGMPFKNKVCAKQGLVTRLLFIPLVMRLSVLKPSSNKSPKQLRCVWVATSGAVVCGSPPMYTFLSLDVWLSGRDTHGLVTA